MFTVTIITGIVVLMAPIMSYCRYKFPREMAPTTKEVMALHRSSYELRSTPPPRFPRTSLHRIEWRREKGRHSSLSCPRMEKLASLFNLTTAITVNNRSSVRSRRVTRSSCDERPVRLHFLPAQNNATGGKIAPDKT